MAAAGGVTGPEDRMHLTFGGGHPALGYVPKKRPEPAAVEARAVRPHAPKPRVPQLGAQRRSALPELCVVRILGNDAVNSLGLAHLGL